MIKTAAISIECDRCKKTVTISDKKQVDAYMKYDNDLSDDEASLVMVHIDFMTGEVKEESYRFLCPKCNDAAKSLFAKAANKKKKKATKKKTQPAEKPQAQKKPQLVPPVEEKTKQPTPAGTDDDWLYAGGSEVNEADPFEE